MQTAEEFKRDEKHLGRLHDLSIFIFRRDLRLEDNSGLIRALKLSKKVLPCFIFDTKQIKPEVNKYFSSNCVQFMIESLEDLNTSLGKQDSRIFFLHDEIESAIMNLIREVKPQAIFVNADISPYSRARDAIIQKLCNENSVIFDSSDDVMMFPPGKVMQDNGEFFSIFTPYYKATLKYTVPEPLPNLFQNYESAQRSLKAEYPYSKIHEFYTLNPNLEVRGGRTKAMSVLSNIYKFKDYGIYRSIASYPTTRLSAAIKFGCLSMREVHFSVMKAFGRSCKLAQELVWRDFYCNILYFHPFVLERNMNDRYKAIKWENNEKLFERWKAGRTGCPIVDAGMRHLNTTGYISNRLRMITANYLTMDLLIDWKLGEKYFAQKLVDYDPANNNGGWQWCAGTGNDGLGSLRIFNPQIQSFKFDNNCEYIFKWVPELRNCKKDHIHNWDGFHHLYKESTEYPAPAVIHAEQKKRCLEMYGLTKDQDEETYEADERLNYRNTTSANYNGKSNSFTPGKGKSSQKKNKYPTRVVSYHKKENNQDS